MEEADSQAMLSVPNSLKPVTEGQNGGIIMDDHERSKSWYVGDNKKLDCATFCFMITYEVDPRHSNE